MPNSTIPQRPRRRAQSAKPLRGCRGALMPDTFLRRPPGRANSARPVAGRRLMRILRGLAGLARLAHKRFQFLDPTRQSLDQRRLLTNDPILVSVAQKRAWGTIRPKIDSETKPLRRPILANHVSSYKLVGSCENTSQHFHLACERVRLYVESLGRLDDLTDFFRADVGADCRGCVRTLDAKNHFSPKRCS
jgi:hypothetical protein